MSLLEVRGLAVTYAGAVEALRGVDLTLDRGETLAVVGESGAGKSTLGRCLIGLVQPPDARGSVRIDGEELLGADAATLRRLRWDHVAIALQGAPFNPVVSIGDQIAEPVRERAALGRIATRRRVVALAEELLLDPALLDRFPHQVSGGERQRASLAMALALDPDLLVLDEPTAGLDPETRHGLLGQLDGLAARRDLGLIVIAHDLAGAARLADRVMVLYAGEAAEAGPSDSVLGDARHPYAWALVNAYPVLSTTKDLRPIRGRPPNARSLPSGCAYHPRCTQAQPVCAEVRPALAAVDGREVACHLGGLRNLLAAASVSKSFGRGAGRVQAVDGASLAVREGEAVGLVGPSGSGKTTLAHMLTGMIVPDRGTVELEGEPLRTAWRGTERVWRQRVQLVAQDPWDALSPRLTVEELVREPLDVGRHGERDERRRRVAEALDRVGLAAAGTFLAARSHELSGGQLQRVALARALVLGPKVLVADEPTALLDASEQARLLVLLREQQVELGLGLVFVSHDLAVVRKVTDRIVVLDRGRVVEEGPSHVVATKPTSPTAVRLLDAAPTFLGGRSR
ncbi:ABC transporter ATP-binding protein [Iamia sp.]|uniref:ABC transporter ATP-binding protein n=1 Tax=Iamia sp. TaxID=2722710 RepID=UPI002B583B82|nr:ABC transporter ATP-binding protein [Iamia sp.]HXH59406.1 ABC transporter ATP-binding protein [Iamia sp.]